MAGAALLLWFMNTPSAEQTKTPLIQCTDETLFLIRTYLYLRSKCYVYGFAHFNLFSSLLLVSIFITFISHNTRTQIFLKCSVHFKRGVFLDSSQQELMNSSSHIILFGVRVCISSIDEKYLKFQNYATLHQQP